MSKILKKWFKAKPQRTKKQLLPRLGVDLSLPDLIAPAFIDTSIGYLSTPQVATENVSAAQPKDIRYFTVKGQVRLTATLTGLSANANVVINDANGSLSTVTGTNGGTNMGTASETLTCTIGVPGMTKTYKSTVYGVSGAATNYSLMMKAMEGWSDASGYNDIGTTTQRNIRDAGRNLIQGALSGQSVGSSVWFTDVSNGSTTALNSDGLQIIAGINEYHRWRQLNPTTNPVPAAEVSAIAAKMPNYSVISYTGQTDDAPKMAQLIITSYNNRPAGSALPTATSTPSTLLAFLKIQKQCFEWAMTQVQNSGGSTRSYAQGSLANNADERDTTGVKQKAWRPGMGIYFYSNEQKTTAYHAAIIVSIKYDADGKPIAIRLAESNYGQGFTHPGGQLPSQRTLSKTREVTISGNTCGGKYFSVMNFG